MIESGLFEVALLLVSGLGGLVFWLGSKMVCRLESIDKELASITADHEKRLTIIETAGCTFHRRFTDKVGC